MSNENNTLEDIEKKLNELTDKVASLEAENTKLKLDQTPGLEDWKRIVRQQSVGMRGFKKLLQEQNPDEEIIFAATGSIKLDDLKHLT
jgi:hypothetical protein